MSFKNDRFFDNECKQKRRSKCGYKVKEKKFNYKNYQHECSLIDQDLLQEYNNEYGDYYFTETIINNSPVKVYTADVQSAVITTEEQKLNMQTCKVAAKRVYKESITSDLGEEIVIEETKKDDEVGGSSLFENFELVDFRSDEKFCELESDDWIVI